MSTSGPGVDTHEMILIHRVIHAHHTGEDELLYPLLRERAALDAELMDRMDAQHAQVSDAVAAIDAELPIMAPRIYATQARRVYGTPTPPRIQAATCLPAQVADEFGAEQATPDQTLGS